MSERKPARALQRSLPEAIRLFRARWFWEKSSSVFMTRLNVNTCASTGVRKPGIANRTVHVTASIDGPSAWLLRFYPCLMLAARITLLHFSVSSAMNLPN
jgi:hypothetical protein